MKKQLLFFLTLILAITPACKQQKQSLAGANASIAAGGTLTALGAIGTPAAATVLAINCAMVSAPLTAATTAGLFFTCMTLPLGLLVIGIPLLVVGIKNKKKIKKQRLLEKLKQEQQVNLEKESEEIQDIDDQNNFIINEK
jgi:1-aminocyclopropane-1-carboxylate deaminase/D-cysteine desulfhydrase-like pyridoxal-dependent ACC family enzyme